MKVVFRTDASLEIGSGHVRRCLTLANALRDKGAECQFVCREHLGNLLDLIRSHGFQTLALPVQDEDAQHPDKVDEPSLAHSAWLGCDWRTDAAQTNEGATVTLVDWLIVDHYALDARWESAMRSQCQKIMVIDDLADRIHDCDLLLDQNLFADMAQRYKGKVPANCGLMLGPDYALLQPQYAGLHPRVPPREGSVRRVLVYFGGADTDNFTGMAIAAFLTLGMTEVVMDVVINTTSPNAQSIRQQANGRSQIILHEDLPSLAQLMVQADLAIGAGGATSWERCCLALPSLVITLAENQKPIASELARHELVRWLGHKNEVSQATLARALKEICSAVLSPDWSERCHQRVDGRGVDRVTSILTINAQSKLKARLARLDDESLFLQWFDDTPVRQNSFSLGAVDPAIHRVWFRKRLRDQDRCRLYVIETTDDFPVGQVRFERTGVTEAWEIHYALVAQIRDIEMVKSLLQTAMLALRASTDKALLFSHINDPNESSRGIFRVMGFESKTQRGRLSIAVCSDAGSWINVAVPDLLLGWLAAGHGVTWTHSARDLLGGDLCFYLSYGRIVDAVTRALYRNNLVVHASDLPKGRGWSPTSWLILENASRIPVTLIEAVDAVDAGPIYLQEWIDLDGTELIDDWHRLLATVTIKLAQSFVNQLPSVLNTARKQSGDSSSYQRRRTKDSALDLNKALAEQFNHLRIVDNDHYPAFFTYKGKEFVLKVFAR